MSIEERMLRDEFRVVLETLSKLNPSDEVYKEVLDNAIKLSRQISDLEKTRVEQHEKEESRHADLALRKQQIADDRKDRIVRNILTGAGIIVPTLVAIWGTVKSFEFEKEGTITTIMGRGFINKLLPKG